ncbi:tetratricopeptide repeat protein [Chitinophaga silvatica]|uniref:tetratricopeptide repeat protein n=1 Tax=Chitinophaga silvatica TaxID=2282649 RepID=UPI0011C11E9B|nr:hypothetical protein [Chitinophaga silvatica]
MNKIRLRQLFYVFAISMLFLSCKSGEKLYNKGRYDEAVKVFVKKLQRKPKDVTANRLLATAYQHAQQESDNRVNSYLSSNNTLKWESVRNEYRAMQNLYQVIHSSPAALQLVKPKDYSTAITGAQENAAEARYNIGVSLLRRNDKASARNAYDEFTATLKLVNHYKDAEQLRDEAFQIGVVNVMVSQLEVRAPYYQFTANQFRDYLINELQRGSVNRFVRFYDEGLAHQDNIRPDEFIDLRFYDFVIGETYVDRLQKDVSKEIIVKTTKDSTGKEINYTQTVKATLFITTKTVVSKGLLDYQITDAATGKLRRTDRLPGSYTWRNQFGTFKGDERALSDEDKKLMGGKDIPPPPPADLFIAFTQPIYANLIRDLQTFYTRLP